MLTRESLRNKGQDVMHDLISSTCEHGLRRGDCEKCGAANSRYARFMGKGMTAASKEKKAATKAMTGTVDMNLQQPCHTSLAGLTYDFGYADTKLQHLGADSVVGCDNTSTNGSCDGFSMQSGGAASSEETISQVGEPCTQPMQQASTPRATLSAVPPPRIPTFSGHLSTKTHESMEEVLKQPLRRPTVLLASQPAALSFTPSNTTWGPMSHCVPEEPQPFLKAPMYVRVPRLEAAAHDYRL